MRSRSLALLTVLALLAGLWVSTSTRAQEEPAQPKVLRPLAAGDARVRIVHASADAPAVDVYVGQDPNAQRVLSNVPFGSISDYLDVTPGTTRIRVVPTGGLLASAVIDASPNLSGGQYYTIAACRPLASVGTPCVTTDDFTAIASGQARVRVFHYAPAPTPTPVDVTADIVGGAPVGVIVDNLAYLAAPAVTTVPANNYNLSVTTADNSVVAATLGAVQIVPGRIYDFFAVGSGANFRLLTSVSNPQAKVRVIHAAAGAPAVDVYVAGNKALSNVSFFQASDYLSVAAGNSVQVYVTLTGQTTPLIAPVNLTFEPGKAYTIAARGDVSNLSSLGYQQYLDDLAAPPAGQAKVRAIHLSPDAPAVALRANGVALPVPALSYPNASPYLAVSAGTYTVQAVVASGPSAGVIAINAPLLTLEAGKIYDVLAVDTVARIRPEIRVTDTQARVRVAHASPTAGPVDVYVDGAKVLSGVTVGSISDYLRVPAGLRRVQVVAPAGGNPSTNSAIDATLTFEANEAYTVAARNNGSTVTAAVFSDEQGIGSAGKAKVRVYHLSAIAPTVDVRVAGTTTPVINDLAPGTASAVLELDPGTYNLEVTNAAGTAVLLTIPDVRIDGRINYDLFALDTAAGPTVAAALSLAQDLPTYTMALPLVTK